LVPAAQDFLEQRKASQHFTLGRELPAFFWRGQVLAQLEIFPVG
jgi:hypothetical protein